MLIEYTIKFEADGLTITQRVEPCGTVSTPKAPVVRNPNGTGVDLGNPIQTSQAAQTNASALDSKLGKGTGEADRTGPGGMPPGGLVIFFGPVVCGGSARVADQEKPVPKEQPAEKTE